MSARVGEPTRPGRYGLADDAYAKLVDKLDGKQVSLELRANILAFYSNRDAQFATKRHRKAWTKLVNEIDRLKAALPVTRSKSQ